MVKINGDSIIMGIANKGLRIVEFAERAEVSPQTFYNVIRRGTCTTAIAGRIANALGVTVEKIVRKEG